MVIYLESENVLRYLFELQGRENRGCSLLTSAFDLDSKATKSTFSQNKQARKARRCDS